MIEIETKMEYCKNDLDGVILRDASGEMEDMKFVPHRTCRIKLMPWSGWHCSACGELATLTGSDEKFKNLNFCPSCGAEVVHRDWS